MRISAPTRSATPYYDRNPLGIVAHSSSNTNVTPHGNTTRTTYTVPSFRNAFLTAVVNTMHRRTVATTVGEVHLALLAVNCSYDTLDTNNTLDAYSRLAVSTMSLMKAGAVTHIETHDLSTGGTMDYFYNSEILEYDA